MFGIQCTERTISSQIDFANEMINRKSRKEDKIMRIVFDLDGTLTDFNKFIDKKAIPYFAKKYGLQVINPNELEIEDIFDIIKSLQKRGLSVKEAENEQKKMLNKFWVSSRFVEFSLLGRFRKNACGYIRYLLKQGHSVEIHTSRAKRARKMRLAELPEHLPVFNACSMVFPLSGVNYFFMQMIDRRLIIY